MKTMSTARAVRVLIAHAAANIRGTGQGIRPETTKEQRTEVRDAIACVFEMANGREMDESDRFNLGI